MKTKISIELNDFIDLKSNLTGSSINQGFSLDILINLVKSADFVVIATTFGKASHLLFYDENSNDIKLKEL